MGAAAESLKSVLHRNLVFVHGKGGVGKTCVSHAIARALSKTGERTLWVTLEDPLEPAGEIRELSPSLWHLNTDFSLAFEEYVGLKIGMAPLTRLFLHNKLIRYMAKAAPGIHELVLLGKIWHERLKYAHVVVDLPSTGYGLAMFQSAENFVKLFHGGPLNRDADAMISTFQDAKQTGHLIVSLPEEMPLRESLDLRDYLGPLFPKNPPAFVANKCYPHPKPSLMEFGAVPTAWSSPVALSAAEYVEKRSLLERFNMKIWEEAGLSWAELAYVPPPLDAQSSQIVEGLEKQFLDQGFV